MEFELGQTYSGYKFLDVVRRSRHAVQYRVQNTLAQRVECLRALTGAAADDPDAAETFLREVRIRARLSHPHIVMFYTAVPIEGRMAMTTELPDSLSLAERLKLGPIPWREALNIANQLLDALACMHQQSFVHCDITPENILFGPGGCCKLAGFSLARPIDPAHKSRIGTIVGDPRYISPEQVKGEYPLDPRSDLYSLGVVLYEMLTGSPPFESRSQFELMMAHVSQAPAPPVSRRRRAQSPCQGRGRTLSLCRRLRRRRRPDCRPAVRGAGRPGGARAPAAGTHRCGACAASASRRSDSGSRRRGSMCDGP
jgi:serine/threonine-protein kinase